VLIVEESKLPGISTILAATFMTVAASVYAHGLSAQPLTDRYAGWYRRHPQERRPRMESVPAAEHPRRRRLVTGAISD
jgi:NhaP-type Na+/H+ or K+/H+ antiporter